MTILKADRHALEVVKVSINGYALLATKKQVQSFLTEYELGSNPIRISSMIGTETITIGQSQHRSKLHCVYTSRTECREDLITKNTLKKLIDQLYKTVE